VTSGKWNSFNYYTFEEFKENENYLVFFGIKEFSSLNISFV
jgi:hypothetical protein